MLFIKESLYYYWRMDTDKITEKQKLCVSCMKCCREVGIYTHPDMYVNTAEELIHFYEARGFSVERSGDMLVLSLRHSCPHLTAAGCDIYEKRPQVCKDYSGPADFGSSCLWANLPGEKKSNR